MKTKNVCNIINDTAGKYSGYLHAEKMTNFRMLTLIYDKLMDNNYDDKFNIDLVESPEVNFDDKVIQFDYAGERYQLEFAKHLII